MEERVKNGTCGGRASLGVRENSKERYFYQKRYREAAETLAQLADDLPQAPFSEDAAFIAGESYRLLHEDSTAEKWFRKVIDRYPGSPVAADARQMLPTEARQDGRETDTP